jgi:hypothetical protein
MAEGALVRAVLRWAATKMMAASVWLVHMWQVLPVNRSPRNWR